MVITRAAQIMQKKAKKVIQNSTKMPKNAIKNFMQKVCTVEEQLD